MRTEHIPNHVIEPEIIIRTIAEKPKLGPFNKKSNSKVKTKMGTNRKKIIKSPRVSFYKHKTGKILKNYHCQTCSSFVRKNQPQCFTCLGIPHIGQKKAAVMQKQIDAAKITKKITDININKRDLPTQSKLKKVSQKLISIKESTLKSRTMMKTKQKIGKKSQRRKQPIRAPCIYCTRRTKCKDRICMKCKSQNETSSSYVTTEVEARDEHQISNVRALNKEAITKRQSVVVKPPDCKSRLKRVTRSLSTSTRKPELVPRSLILSENVQSGFNQTPTTGSKKVPEKELSVIISDLENLLSASATENDQEKLQAFFISPNHIDSVIEEGGI